jgi:hypothetical protein
MLCAPQQDLCLRGSQQSREILNHVAGARCESHCSRSRIACSSAWSSASVNFSCYGTSSPAEACCAPGILRYPVAHLIGTSVVPKRTSGLGSVLPSKKRSPESRLCGWLQEESEWQTVGTRRNRHGDSSPAAASYLAGENPLLSHTAQTAPRGVMYPDGAHAPYGSSYYQQGTHGSMFGAGPLFWAEPADDSGSDFPGRRGLPTRQDDLF